MSERTVALEFFNFVDEEGVGQSVRRGETYDFDSSSEERGDYLGAFEDSPEPDTVSDVEAAYGVSGIDPESGVPHLHTPPSVTEEELEVEEIEGDPEDQPDPLGEAYPDLAEDANQELPEGDTPEGGESPKAPERSEALATSDQIDSLSGTALEQACQDAGIDTSTGGSLAGGQMSANEKRDALKAACP